ncbi:MAG TPA: C1 family peptidase [Methanospirillum sp.]|nr:C1 family peptidase [Methanospirillum sp.]
MLYCRRSGAIILVISLCLLCSAEWVSADTCAGCLTTNNISINGFNLEDIKDSNLSAFRQMDPRDIGRAMDISGYNLSEGGGSSPFSDVIDLNQTDQEAAVMSMTLKVILALQEASKNLPRFSPPDEFSRIPPENFSLLSNLSYIPSEWDQTGGSDEHCGNCWVWADTGALQLDMAYQKGIKDRLSVQYFVSNYHNGTGIWACCGGSPVWFADFYDQKKMAIPWNNTNAEFQDATTMCEKGESSKVPGDLISTEPAYPIDHIEAHIIPTISEEEEHQITNSSAIQAIKAALRTGKGVLFLYTPDDWDPFMEFWNNLSENAVFTPTPGPSYAEGKSPGGHVVLVVGYNDTDPKNRYWIVLNSWGGPKNRPNGLFRMTMDLDYSYQYKEGVHAYEWSVLNVTYPETFPTAPLGQ